MPLKKILASVSQASSSLISSNLELFILSHTLMLSGSIKKVHRLKNTNYVLSHCVTAYFGNIYRYTSTMGPKDIKKSSSKKGKKTHSHTTSTTEPHLRSVDDWVDLGKESLILISNSLNMKVKGLTVRDLADALVNKYTKATEVGYRSNDEHLEDQMNKSDREMEERDGDDDDDGGDADRSTSSLMSGPLKARRAHSFKTKKQKILRKPPCDMDDFKNSLVIFLKEQIHTEIKNALPPSRKASSPQPPPSSLFPVAGSLAPTVNNGDADVDFVQDTVCSEAPLSGSPSPAVLGPSGSFASLPPVPKRILEKIKAGEYINFDMLLPPVLAASTTSSVSSLPMDDAGEFDINIKNVDGNPRISLSQVTLGKPKVRDYPTWLLAWSNYLRCMVRFFPHLVDHLVTYQTMMAQYATQYNFASVYASDQLHRIHMANDPSKRWDVIDDMILNLHLKNAPTLKKKLWSDHSTNTCFSCKEVGHFEYNCPQKASLRSNGESFRNGDRRGSMFCRKFNQVGFCPFDGCPFSHSCDICKRNHPSVRCPLRASRQGTR